MHNALRFMPALLTLRARSLFAVGTVLCTVQCLIPSLASTHRMPVNNLHTHTHTHTLTCDNQGVPRHCQRVHLGSNIPLVENLFSRGKKHRQRREIDMLWIQGFWIPIQSQSFLWLCKPELTVRSVIPHLHDTIAQIIFNKHPSSNVLYLLCVHVLAYSMNGFVFSFLSFLFLLNLSGWHWLMKLYRFQVYNSTIHHLYIIILCFNHPKSNLILSPFIPPFPSSTCPHPTFPLVITVWLFVSICWDF